MITSSGQWCQKHNIHQDHPEHEYVYPGCEYYLRDATLTEESVFLSWPAMAQAHLSNLREDLALYKEWEKEARARATKWQDWFWGAFWMATWFGLWAVILGIALWLRS